MIKTRCSDNPITMKCGESQEVPDPYIDDDNEIKRMGSAAHGALERIVKEGLKEPPELSPYLHRWGLPTTMADELRFLSWSGLKIWDDLHGSLRLLESEAELSFQYGDVLLTGHPDILAEADGDCLVVIDFKSGYVDRDYNDQLMGYVRLAWSLYPSYKRAKIITVWLRDGESFKDDVSKADIEAWTERFIERITGPRRYVPGPHCVLCKRKYEPCPAMVQKMRATAEWMRTVRDNEEEGIGFKGSIDDMALQYNDVKSLVKLGEEFKEVFRNGLEHDGRKISDGEGKVLYFELSDMDQIIPDVAVDAMCEELGADPEGAKFVRDNPDLFKISKTSFLDLVAAGYSSGKGKARARATESLREAGGFRVAQKRNIKQKKGTADPVPERKA